MLKPEPSVLAFVSNGTLPGKQGVHQPMSEDDDIFPWPTWIWTIDPYNIPCLNVDCDLVLDSWPIELVALPF